MIDIDEYITLLKEQRQIHIRLDEECILRGGNSENSRGLLAYILDTTIPKGQRIHLCHACHNGLCSNPNHMYWGTSKENTEDRMANGGKNIWQHMVEKYGYENACIINARNKVGNKSGFGNKDKPKSEEHKRKIAANHKGGRKKIIDN
jgi:hypothetical protein